MFEIVSNYVFAFMQFTHIHARLDLRILILGFVIDSIVYATFIAFLVLDGHAHWDGSIEGRGGFETPRT